jgi:glycolate oxidase FAD binding subunit
VSTVADRVRAASEAREPLRIAGAATWLEAGAPVNADDRVELRADAGITEYVPRDLTLTARAGTTLAEITAATRAHDQWLPLDPWGGDDGTLGATLATGTAGPHAHAMGLPRDVVLGVEFVTGDARVVRSGGRVVKNVAGFDLTRLVVGAWGSLGIIVEATVRLRARPQATRTVAVPVKTTAAELNALASRLRALPFTPLASELVNATLAARLGLRFHPTLLLRCAGNAQAVAAQLDRLREVGVAEDVDDAIWDRLRTAEREHARVATWRWSRLPAEFGDTWSAAERATRDIANVFVHGNPARGVARIVCPETGKPAAMAKLARTFDGTVIIERLPVDAWPAIIAATPKNPLAHALRARFDPAGILNPGIMGGLA